MHLQVNKPSISNQMDAEEYLCIERQLEFLAVKDSSLNIIPVTHIRKWNLLCIMNVHTQPNEPQLPKRLSNEDMSREYRQYINFIFV